VAKVYNGRIMAHQSDTVVVSEVAERRMGELFNYDPAQLVERLFLAMRRECGEDCQLEMAMTERPVPPQPDVGKFVTEVTVACSAEVCRQPCHVPELIETITLLAGLPPEGVE